MGVLTLRSFSVGATIWNQLPIMIKSSETVNTVFKKLKTYLFEIDFPPYIVGSSTYPMTTACICIWLAK